MSESRYIIGIDLGTTNSTVAYVDTQDEIPNSQSFKIPQIIAPGETEAAESLPSFLFLPEMSTLGPGSLNLPWNSEDADTAVGAYAKKVSSTQPGRIVSSAKSWLCSENVDRMASILPTGSQDERKSFSG